MKILQLISSVGFFGAESVVLELSKALRSCCTENVIGVFENSSNPHTELASLAKENNLRTQIFPCKGRFNAKTLWNIKNFIEGNGIDIIHTHGSKPNAYGFAASRMTKKAIVATCHNRIENSLVSGDKGIGNYLSNRLYYSIDNSILPRFDKVIAVSEDVKRLLLENRIDGGRISVVYNGVDAGKFIDRDGGKIRAEFNIDKNTMIVGTVARLTQEKGLSNLLLAAKEVLNQFPDTIFMLAGDGPLRDDLIKKTAESGIKERVIFTGQRNDIPEVYSSLDIFVLPSLIEGLPMVLLEAMAAGKPVIATRVGAIPGVIEDGKDGIIINPGDIGELKEAIISIMTDPELARRFSQNAFKKVSEQFSSDKMCSRHMEIYSDVLLKRSKVTYARQVRPL